MIKPLGMHANSGRVVQSPLMEREFDSPILRARCARKIGLLGLLRVAQQP
jgi:hypothetical protein